MEENTRLSLSLDEYLYNEYLEDSIRHEYELLMSEEEYSIRCYLEMEKEEI